ncbi:4-(cytidine 5'-diphospho)-2-C-methyl-D-erythritol kinase [Fundidesulfovibrio agrisoli]|uniref:4-(cytidine 5'-diphospho)-2-C-methyl-D-erythritol kinase n=1 Tax=Fundidesulfovibrio agrisoli TaxID=2922717 RepID=UPI001FAC5EDA|nr:4-(cytidine 5'-diphospho)-2-C-methyl-D-erythritol kinase [Fundidesulfovibrio agrisoli]
MSDALRIGCKVNIYLEIAGVRPDGYHELRSLFHPVAEPHDVLRLTPGGEPGLRLACSDPALSGPDNLVAKAYEAFARRTGSRPGLTARLEKAIPSGAGLGGGSADAAAMLGWLNDHAGAAALERGELSALAASLGADVPFFLLGRPAWATGIGEKLEPVETALTGLYMVLAVPPERVNTAWAYRAWDAMHLGDATQSGTPRLTSGCPASMRPFCVSGTFIANSFESAVFRDFPGVRRLKQRMTVLGAAASCMSGSGSAVFGLFRNQPQAGDARDALAGEGHSVWLSRL